MAQKKRKYYNQSFCKGGSAAFLVESTFQLMCAREAIHEFEIEDYHIVMATFQWYGPRNQQMLAMASNWGYTMERIDMETVDFQAFLTSGSSLDDTRKRYDRVFIGNSRCLNMLVIASNYACKGGAIVALDDGTATLAELNGFYHISKPLYDWIEQYHWFQGRRFYYQRLQSIYNKLEEKGIVYSYCFYTIFDDVKNNNYITYKNSFTHLLSHRQMDENANVGVAIVGTRADELARIYAVETSYMEHIFYEKMQDVRNVYPTERIVYIPHPRDVNTNIKNFCKELNIEYLQLSEPVESYVLSHSKALKAVYGFGSTALIVLKRVLNNLSIIDFEFAYINHSKIDKTRLAMNLYYKKSGIQTIQIIIPSHEINSRRKGVLYNCKALLQVLIRKLN